MSQQSPTFSRQTHTKSGNVTYGGSQTTFQRHSSSLRRPKESMSKPKSLQVPSVIVPIIVDDLDVTPHTLSPYLYEGGKELQISSILEHLTKDASMLARSLSRDSQKFQATLLMQKQDTESNIQKRSLYIASSYGDDILMTDFTVSSSRSDMSKEISEDEEVCEREAPTHKIPKQISLILQETETIFLLDLPSSSVLRGSEETEAVEEDNRLYDFLTKGKGRNRKVLNVAVQTLPILMKARDTETEKIRYKNKSTYCSTWEMYDTFHQQDEIVEDEEEGEEEEEEIVDDENALVALDLHKLNDEVSVQSYRLSSEEKQINKLVKSKAFFDALIIIERILGNNCYNEEQKCFKGLSEPNYLRLDVTYKYKLRLLWSYSNEYTDGKCVTAIALNDFNEDIVAAAYGKYYYNDKTCTGMVMIWNFKNPTQPERHYTLKYPVTSISFSKVNPNLLAVGMYNGDIKILDVSKREENVIRENKTTSFEPVWNILWFQQGSDEDIIASFGDGRVCKFQITGAQELKCTQIMVTASAEGKLKGISYSKKCEDKNISINRYEEARTLAFHPSDPYTYFVGTSEGVVHRCSTNYYNEHMDLFKAHEGALSTFRFSPWANKLYYTVGDDFRTRLWADGISEPLVTSEPTVVSIHDLDWSPTHPTVLASVRGESVMIWDFLRKIHFPQSIMKNPNNVLNTCCRFTQNGRCLMVGDIGGGVHVYSLEDMPCTPFFPEALVTMALKRLLVTKPELMKKLKKLGGLSFEDSSSPNYFHN